MLRLTHLKRLARALSSTVKENGDQNHLSGTQGISSYFKVWQVYLVKQFFSCQSLSQGEISG